MNTKVKALLFMKAYSERLPNKNILPLCSKPLFHWIMDALIESGVVEEIIINTDSEKIAESAQMNFDVTIHMRPDYLRNLQSDEAYQIMDYDLQFVKGEHFIQTHSTTPLIKPNTIRDAVKQYFENIENKDSLFSVTAYKKRLFDKHGIAINHDPKTLVKVQNLPEIYEENSCIYIFSRSSFEKNKNRLGRNPFFLKMNKYESVDIDEKFEFEFAETLMQQRLQNSENEKK